MMDHNPRVLLILWPRSTLPVFRVAETAHKASLFVSLAESDKTGAPGLVAAHRRGSPFGPFDRALSKRSNQVCEGISPGPTGAHPSAKSPIPEQQLWWET
jgi:hypothetical protein